MATVLVPSGVCHCGAEMLDHPVWDNHSPVEMMRPVKTPDPDPDAWRRVTLMPLDIRLAYERNRR